MSGRLWPVGEDITRQISFYCMAQLAIAERSASAQIGYFSASGSSADYRARYTKRRGADTERLCAGRRWRDRRWPGRAERPLLAPGLRLACLRTPNRMTGGNTGDDVVVEAGRAKGTAAAVDRSDELWARIEPLLPVVPRRADHPGHRRLDDRKVLCGILFVLYTGISWEFLPQQPRPARPGPARPSPGPSRPSPGPVRPSPAARAWCGCSCR
jgi:Putative transposase of IS4/5 family (DUF4096)